MRDLNKAQVQNELTRRWGKKAYGRLNPHAMLQPQRDLIRTLMGGVKYAVRWTDYEQTFGRRCSVGYISNVVFSAFHVEGQGDTWREAFANADKHKARRAQESAA